MDKFNILVCDDEKSIVDAIEIYLKQENYNVIKAYNGMEALKALKEKMCIRDRTEHLLFFENHIQIQ